MSEPALAAWAFWMLAVAIFAFGGEHVYGFLAVVISCIAFALDWAANR